MKKLLLTFVVLLSGCALFPSPFDAQEHARIVTINVVSRDSSVCAKPERAQAVAETMYRDAEWAHAYGSTLSDNAPMAKMELELVNMTKELRDRYSHSEPVSNFYCKSKFENIHRATTTIIGVSARRPR
jgi:hypothetical protein